MDQPAPFYSPETVPSTNATKSSHLPMDIAQLTYGAVRINPTEAIYDGLEKDENVVLYLGRHWTQLLYGILHTVVLAAIPIIVFGTFFFIEPKSIPINYLIIATWFWYCFTFYYLLSRIITWRSNVYIVTNKRIINIDTKEFFFNNATDTDLDSIYEVHYSTGGGLIGGGINRGTIILTNVSGGQTTLKNIPYPSEIALILGELVEEAKATLNKTPEPI